MDNLSNLKTEDLLAQLREKLNKDEVKLWLPPYFLEGIGSCDQEMKKLAANYSNALKVDEESCLLTLNQLQSNALDRLKEREHFQGTGVATLKVRIPGQSQSSTNLQIKLTACVWDLQDAVAKKVGIDADSIKLIWNGRVLKPAAELKSEGLRNGAQIMAVILKGNTKELQAFDSHYQLLENTMSDAKLLASSTNAHSDQYLQIADQTGKTLDLPAEERQALVVAMSLHEKGRSAMKNENYSLALILLLEADREFSRCQSQILESVDNYALLNLDIAWCYLCLKNVTQLPDAEKRLGKCENNFHRSYGPNLERLMALKGTTGNEAALFMRLHLLQGIVLFHQNKKEEASKLFQRAELELRSLKVSDTSLAYLLEIGYTASEARLGLRATHGDVNAAAERITQERQDKKLREEEDRQKHKLGRCADKTSWVKPAMHAELMTLGFSSSEARIALQKSNNDFNKSLDLLKDKDSLMKDEFENFPVLPEWVQQIVALGFDPRMAKTALQKNFGDIEKAIEELLSTDGIIPDFQDVLDMASNSPLASTSQGLNLLQQEREAYDRLSEGMSRSDNDYLDLTLIIEEEFLKQYQALL